MPVMVEQVTQTKSGKALRVLLGGTWYNAFIDSGLNGQVGKYIEAEIKVHEKFGPSIVGWKPSVQTGYTPPSQLAGAGAPSIVPPPAAIPSPHVETTREPVYAEPNKNVAPYWLPFASNTVNAAIAAGIIKDPKDIRAWLLACKVAAVSHDNDLPF